MFLENIYLTEIWVDASYYAGIYIIDKINLCEESWLNYIVHFFIELNIKIQNTHLPFLIFILIIFILLYISYYLFSQQIDKALLLTNTLQNNWCNRLRRFDPEQDINKALSYLFICLSFTCSFSSNVHRTRSSISDYSSPWSRNKIRRSRRPRVPTFLRGRRDTRNVTAWYYLQ